MCSDNATGADNQQERLNAYTGIDVRKLICVAVQLWLSRERVRDPGQCIEVGNQNPQRPYAGHHRNDGEDMVRPAWRHAEPDRNDLAH